MVINLPSRTVATMPQPHEQKLQEVVKSLTSESFIICVLGARPKIDFLRTDPSPKRPYEGYSVQCALANDGTAPMLGSLGSILFPLSSFF
jgi:hypothetical protein